MASSRRGSYHVQEGPSGRADLDLEMDHYDTFRTYLSRSSPYPPSPHNMHFKTTEPEKSIRAKQRASVAWIVQKAHKNKVPTDLQDPYYRDYEGVEHLKPGIVHRLANADLYCSALANIYGDPNFHNLSHWNIIQALARKGVYVAEPTDVALTETVLIQVSPIKMSAHLAVIEAMMALYIREVVVAERVVSVLQRVGGGAVPERTPQDQEEALVLWVSCITQALQDRIHHHAQAQEQELPVFPRIQDLSDLSDGIGLAALVAFYCPQELSWQDIAVADPPSIADSLYNVGLVIRFCQESLPYNPCLLTKEDVVYMHSSVKQNVLAFAAELFFLLELEPVSCVSLPGSRKMSAKYIQLSSPAMKPAGAPSVRRSQSMNLNDMTDQRVRLDHRQPERFENTPSSYNSDYGGRDSSMSDGQEGDFVVQRSKGLSTLSDMMRTQSPRPSHDFDNIPYSSRSAAKEKLNMDSKEEELGERSRGLGRRGSFNNSHPDLPAAGMPSRYEERPHGRSRSRRNSISAEDSQLTIENFGGSQDNLNYISRNPDKEQFVHSGRRESSNMEGPLSRESREGSMRPESRSSRERSVERRLDLHRGSTEELDNRYVDKLEKEALEREKRDLSMYASKEKLLVQDQMKSTIEVADSGSESDVSFDRDKQMVKATSFAELSKLKEQLPSGINIIYMQSDKDDGSKRSSKGSEKKTTFAALPNQTTWKQQTAQSHSDDNKSASDENMEPQVMASELHNVRLKLEEKRRRIENEKRKMEQAMNNQRQKLGKEAFMQAVVKGGKGSSTGSSTPTTSDPDAQDTMVDSVEQSVPKHPSSNVITATQLNPDLSLKDISSEVNNVSRRWLEGEAQSEEVQTPDLDTMDYDQYHQSLTHGESGMEGSRRSSMDNPYAAQLRRKSYVGPDPRERTPTRTPRPDLRRMSLYLEPGTWRAGHDLGLVPSAPSRRISMGPDSFTPPYRMTDSLTEIQGDIQRLSHQQQQIQSLMHNGMNSPAGQSMQQPPGQFYLHDQQQSSPVRRLWGQQQPPGDSYASMSPASRRAQWGPARPMMPQGDYMMAPQHPGYYPGYQMNHMGQMPPQPPMPSGAGQGFMLHGQPQSLPHHNMYQNGQGYYSPEHQYRGYPSTAQSYGSSDQQRQMGQTPPFRLHREGGSSGGGESWGGSGGDSRGPSSLRSSAQSSPSRQPMQRQQKSPSPPRQPPVSHHAPVAAPPPDDMEPQSVSFINSTDDQNSENQRDDSDMNDKFKRLSITSGSKTYRISHEPGSPTRPSLGVKTYRVPTKRGTPVIDNVDLPQPAPPQRSRTPPYHQDNGNEDDDELNIKAEPLQEGVKGDKGFYISFDSDSGPRKPKPQLRSKKMSRKNSSPSTPATTPSKEELPVIPGRYYEPPPGMSPDPPSSSHGKPSVRLRNKPPGGGGGRPRPKTMAGSSVPDVTDEMMYPSHSKKGSTHNIAGEVGRRGDGGGPGSMRKSSGRWGSSHSLSRASGSRGSNSSLTGDYPSTSRTLDRGHTGRRPTSVIGYSSLARGEDRKPSLYRSQGAGLNYGEDYRVHEARRPSLAVEGGGSRLRRGYNGGPAGGYRKYRSTGNLSGQSEHDSLVYHMSEDSGLGRATPPRRAPSPGMARHLPSPSGPGSLPPGLFSKRRQGGFDDAASDISSTTSSTMDYHGGPRLFKQPTAKSNRTIILNAVEYCVFPGMVNQTAKHRVLEEIARSESKHFLILFRDAGCQFRAIYSFNPESEEVYKLYGTGPKQVNDRMFDKFFKYNSGGKCFSQIHTKHLTVTIDAFTIHNSLWQGKRVNLPPKKDMTLVI
ncbi:hypothetical protein O3P69_001012 [Scylla paramamosain]|uniref:Patronin n=1 Tax=Scylla paramamosain TaxID=85552 RepID=A0AAW0UTD9_SCYPA